MALSDHIKKDTPTNTFCTLNPLDLSGGTLSDGNLRFVSDGGWDGVRASFSYDYTNKYYLEVFVEARATGISIGVLKSDVNILGDLGNSSSAYVYNSGDGYIYNNGSPTSYGNSYGTGNIIGVLWDNGSVYFYKDGIIQNSGTAAVTSLTGTWVFAVNVNGSDKVKLNFGQDPTFGGSKTDSAALNPQLNDANGASTKGAFYYTPPAGAKALCTANLEDITPNVDDDVPGDYMKAVKYDGNGGTQSITGVGFTPDFVWQKSRDDTYLHVIIDSVRGNNNLLCPHSSDGTRTPVLTNGEPELAIINDGFKVTYTTTGTAQNALNKRQIAWCFRAGGAPSGSNIYMKDDVGYETLSAAGITAGTITPTAMSVNTKAGLSIVKYTGNSTEVDASDDLIPHGLNSAPEFFVLKDTSRAGSWNVGISNITGVNNQYIRLNEALTTYTNMTIQADSNVIRLNHYNAENTVEYICYAWHSVAGYSKFGSYEGNGSTDGPFIYTGFKPAWVMTKATFLQGDSNNYNSWTIVDNVRSPYNPTTLGQGLWANSGNREGYRTGDNSTQSSEVHIDILSNGFKVRNTSYETGQSGTYIYAAFAEQPFTYATAR